MPRRYPIAVSIVLMVWTTLTLASQVLRAQQFEADVLLFDRYVEALRQQLRIPGVSAAIVRNGQPIWVHGYGYQDVEARMPTTPDTLYDIASVSKTFASTLLLQCVERGTLDLDEPIRRYTTAIPEPSATVRHVLTHTSQGVPGAVYRYDGGRYAALTDVVAACAGQPYPQVVAHQILDRLAMFGSVPGHEFESPSAAVAAGFDAPTLARYRTLIGRLATPYISTATGIMRTDFPPRSVSASAGLLSSVVDLAKYDAAIDASVLVAPETQALAWTNAVSTTTGQPLPYGLGWFVQQHRGHRLVWHYGLWPQYSALYLKLPDDQLTLILLANSGGLNERFPLANGDVTSSPFARAFLNSFL
jgi:CubicO group peptidase (beta-lactamase class C family)